MADKFLLSALLFVLATNSSKGLNCYSCTFNFNDVYDSQDGWCANDTLYTMPKKEVVRPCAPWETQCSTAIMTTLNSFTSITRGCAVSCSELCDAVGYGQDQVTCSTCCDSDLCNKETNVTFFMKVMEKQETDWFTAFPEEIKFNRENKLRFPY